MWPFGKRTYLEGEDEQWQIETWRWFAAEFGPVASIPLVTPTREFFPPTEMTGTARAEYVFDRVKQLAGMGDRQCRLIAQPRSAELQVADVGALKPIKHAPAGTFSFDGNDAVISYDPANTEPVKLIATFAHELAHYRLAGARHEAPGGEDLHEYTTDLMTVYLGFGLFSANSAFNFSQHHSPISQGWQYSRQGYLGERALVFALAIFLEVKDQPSDTAKQYIKSHLFSDLQKARRYLRKNRVLA